MLEVMSAYVIGVVRSATGLATLAYEATEPADSARPWLRQERCELRALSQGERPELWRSWHALEAVRDWNQDTLAHVLTVLRETVPSLDVPADLPALGAEC